MAEDQDKDDKTEDASERRIEQALERGDVARSAELTGFITLLMAAGATAGAFVFAGPLVVARLKAQLAGAHAISLDGPPVFAAQALATAGMAVAAPFLAVVVGAIAAALMMHPPVFTTEPLTPKASRISPMAGAKRLFGKENLIQFAKTCLKLALAAGVVAAALWPERARLAALTLSGEPGHVVLEAARLSLRVFAAALILYAALAVADAVHQRFAWKKRLRMSLEEVKREHKESEGDPAIKSRIRALRQRQARQRMIAAVPKATVIIVNPTHYSVALRYEPGMAAPVCVAKGLDEVALKIRQIARERRIPVIENPPLARALHAVVEVDAVIPPEHYKAVAEVIGFVMRLKRRRQ